MFLLRVPRFRTCRANHTKCHLFWSPYFLIVYCVFLTYFLAKCLRLSNVIDQKLKLFIVLSILIGYCCCLIARQCWSMMTVEWHKGCMYLVKEIKFNRTLRYEHVSSWKRFNFLPRTIFLMLQWTLLTEIDIRKSTMCLVQALIISVTITFRRYAHQDSPYSRHLTSN